MDYVRSWRLAKTKKKNQQELFNLCDLEWLEPVANETTPKKVT